ncbi:ABC transporter ATP-binding protein [Allopusillimonas ginsengisoli]|nr:ABC transporter ATP-binding protein [Allopusillimonas ginsengisoli]
MSFLRLQGISKSYGRIRVVTDIDLSVEKGEFVSLLGPSGCGKTTTLQMIAGFVEPSSGSIELDGRDITNTRPNTRGLGIVFQTYALFPHMTVTQNVAFGLVTRKVPAAEQAERVEHALALVKLDQHGDRYPRELSGGQRQRVALARALVIRPPILLLDEPLSNLDAKLREEMQYELRSIQRSVGTTTIMVTHDQSEALSTSDRVVVMQEGRAIQVDEPYKVYEHPESSFISQFVGKTNFIDGQVEETDGGQVIRCGATTLTVSLPMSRPGQRVRLSLRPEKLLLVDEGKGQLPACQVTSRFFLGSQWLYRLNTPVGSLTVVSPNTGFAPLAVNDQAGIDWADQAVRVLPLDA